jgi:beta-glucosidase
MTAIISGFQGEIPANGRLGAPFVSGQHNVAACAMHYVGDGGTINGINENNTIATFHELLSIHMPPYYNAIIRGVSTIMVSFSSLNGVKMHTHRPFITDFLKTKLRFRVCHCHYNLPLLTNIKLFNNYIHSIFIKGWLVAL